MSTPSPELRLFGIDLPAVWREIGQAWRKVLHLPALAWLGPRPIIELREAQGGTGLWAPSGAEAFLRKRDGVEGMRSMFQAVELPEDIVLRKQLGLPLLSHGQLVRAIELEALSSSPFPHSDLAWGYATVAVPGRAGHLHVEMALASRRRIEQCLATRAAGAQFPEVWVRGATPDTAFILRGYGEAHRWRLERRGWCVLGGGALLTLVLLAAIAVTPSLQLRQRALQAMAASAQLVEQARPQVAQREALLAANERVHALETIVGNRLNPLQTMHVLTNVLGDDTVLQRLQIEGRNVLIAGQTPDTASMMQKLSAQPGFKGVRAPSAATRPAGATKETFQVEFMIDDEVSAAAAPPVLTASEAKP